MTYDSQNPPSKKYSNEVPKIQIPLCDNDSHKWSVHWLIEHIKKNEKVGWEALDEPEENKKHFEKCLICGIPRDDVEPETPDLAEWGT